MKAVQGWDVVAYLTGVVLIVGPTAVFVAYLLELRRLSRRGELGGSGR
ncbi:MAG: hypothetical protein AB1816_12310 [Bacillota bacterium]